MANPNEIRAAFITTKDVMNDIKFIAVFDKKKQKDLMGEILTSYIADWKSKNKGVKFPAKG